MEYIPISLAFFGGVVGLGTICSAWIQIWRQGGWKQAMAMTPDGKWSSARRLMYIGAMLCCGFSLFLSALILFGGLPWQS